MPIWKEIDIVFDATSAKAHVYNFGKMKDFPEKKMVDYFMKISGLKDDDELSETLNSINKINNIIDNKDIPNIS